MINYLKHKRVDKDLTQQELAELVGISRSRYAKIEAEYDKALENMRFFEIEKLAHVYNLTVDEFAKNYRNSLKIVIN